jgi:hypothetical protein
MRAGQVGAEPCGMDPIREVVIMTATVDLFARQSLQQRRVAAAAAFAALVLLVAAALVAATEDIGTQAALRGYLDRAEGQMPGLWILAVLVGLAVPGGREAPDAALRWRPGSVRGGCGIRAGRRVGRGVAGYCRRCAGCASDSAAGVQRVRGRPLTWRARPVRPRWAWPYWGWPPRSGRGRGRCRRGLAG